MILARKWDFDRKVYLPYNIPSACVLGGIDMNDTINCASCGKKLKFGESYTSKCIHNIFGLGFAVCAECNTKEFEAERTAEKEIDQ